MTATAIRQPRVRRTSDRVRVRSGVFPIAIRDYGCSSLLQKSHCESALRWLGITVFEQAQPDQYADPGRQKTRNYFAFAHPSPLRVERATRRHCSLEFLRASLDWSDAPSAHQHPTRERVGWNIKSERETRALQGAKSAFPLRPRIGGVQRQSISR